jgi:hypothetical protein
MRRKSCNVTVISTILIGFIFLCSFPAQAITISAGQTVKVAFDFTGEALSPSYDFLRYYVDIDTIGEGISAGEGWTVTAFDALGNEVGNSSYVATSAFVTLDAGLSLNVPFATWSGFLIFDEIIGSIGIDSISVRGAIYVPGPVYIRTEGTEFVEGNISTVPIPPTVWLLASGLFAVLGLSKR